MSSRIRLSRNQSKILRRLLIDDHKRTPFPCEKDEYRLVEKMSSTDKKIARDNAVGDTWHCMTCLNGYLNNAGFFFIFGGAAYVGAHKLLDEVVPASRIFAVLLAWAAMFVLTTLVQYMTEVTNWGCVPVGHVSSNNMVTWWVTIDGDLKYRERKLDNYYDLNYVIEEIDI